jgi:hypothetical protein
MAVNELAEKTNCRNFNWYLKGVTKLHINPDFLFKKTTVESNF